MNFQPMAIQLDLRAVSKIFFPKEESPAYDDSTGSEDGVSNIFSQG